MNILKDNILVSVYQKNSSKFLFSFSIISLLLVMVLTSSNFYYLYKQVGDSQESIVFSELKNKALIMSSVIDLDAYEIFLNSKAQDENNDYLKILAPLRKAHASIEGIRYVYTVYLKSNEGKPAAYFGLDTAQKIDADKDGVLDHSDFRSEYSEAPKEIFDTVKSGQVTYTDKPYEDKYGIFISAFIPLKNKKGEVFSVLGIDMLYTHYKSLLDGYKSMILKNFLVCIFLISVFTLMLYLFYSKITNYKIKQVSLKNELKNQQDFFIQDSKMVEVGKMVAGITHEINNPLTIIKGFADQGIKRLQRGNTEVDVHLKNYENIKSSSERIIEIIHNMKSIVARPVGKGDFYHFNLEEAIANVLKAIKYKSISENVKLDVDIDKNLIIYGNKSQLEQVFFNLMSNSIDAIYADQDPWIKIRVELDEHFSTLHFIDSGKGLTPEIYAQIEQGFYTSKPNGNGSGMGIMICKKIISIHEGTLDFVKDETTHFVIRIPNDEQSKKNLDEVS